MRRLLLPLLCGLAVPLTVLLLAGPVSGGALREPVPLPEFTHEHAQDWLNSAPLRVADLRGRVVLLDFWTFDCWNCYRSFPWLKELAARLESDGLQVIGVHTPEFDHEKLRDNVIGKAGEFGLSHPIMIDNDFSYWRALGNRYWPAWYVIDRAGNARAVFVGETHAGDAQAIAIETLLKQLLAEPAGHGVSRR